MTALRFFEIHLGWHFVWTEKPGSVPTSVPAEAGVRRECDENTSVLKHEKIKYPETRAVLKNMNAAFVLEFQPFQNIYLISKAKSNETGNKIIAHQSFLPEWFIITEHINKKRKQHLSFQSLYNWMHPEIQTSSLGALEITPILCTQKSAARNNQPEVEENNLCRRHF